MVAACEHAIVVQLFTLATKRMVDVVEVLEKVLRPGSAYKGVRVKWTHMCSDWR